MGERLVVHMAVLAAVRAAERVFEVAAVDVSEECLL